MVQNTHKKIDTALSGKVVEISKDYAKVKLKTLPLMAADEEGLVHGGFCFSSADFAAMVAVNDPYVVLAKSEVKFKAPVVVGDEVVFEARVIESDGRKYSVDVVGKVGEREVFGGIFYAVVLKDHILK